MLAAWRGGNNGAARWRDDNGVWRDGGNGVAALNALPEKKGVSMMMTARAWHLLWWRAARARARWHGGRARHHIMTRFLLYLAHQPILCEKLSAYYPYQRA